jgi:twitching motility protein PilT
VLLQSYAVSNLIRENKVHQIDGYLLSAEHAGSGMQALDSGLFTYIKEGLVSVDEAIKVASYPDTLRKLAAELPEDS